MPNSPNWLSVEQREEMRERFGTPGYSDSVWVSDLLDHAAEADRREAELREQLAAKDAEIAAAHAQYEILHASVALMTPKLEKEHERLRAALKAADRELINAVCDGAYYKPDETRMKIFRDGLREALAATPPAPKSPGLPAPLVLCVVCRKVIVGVGDTCRTCAATPPAKEGK